MEEDLRGKEESDSSEAEQKHCAERGTPTKRSTSG
jgi:hypothetical protein